MSTWLKERKCPNCKHTFYNHPYYDKYGGTNCSPKCRDDRNSKTPAELRANGGKAEDLDDYADEIETTKAEATR